MRKLLLVDWPDGVRPETVTVTGRAEGKAGVVTLEWGEVEAPEDVGEVLARAASYARDAAHRAGWRAEEIDSARERGRYSTNERAEESAAKATASALCAFAARFAELQAEVEELRALIGTLGDRPFLERAWKKCRWGWSRRGALKTAREGEIRREALLDMMGAVDRELAEATERGAG